MNLVELVTNVFGSPINEKVDSFIHDTINNQNVEIQQIIQLIENHISGTLKTDGNVKISEQDDRLGRLGPKLVRLDTTNHYGLFIVSPDRLSVNSQSNFSTVRANTGVFKGKWQYEVQLGSNGVMQIGWGTADCKFSQESGVGDMVNSYAYDGNRIRKWNVSTHKYGEAWLSGDIIGCAIDFDNENITFFRNGKNLGIAFEKISMGPGIVYFPTVSLTFTENLTANFGTTPLRYPVSGYQSLQLAPTEQLQKSKILFQWLEKLLHQYKNVDSDNESNKEERMMSNRALLACLARCILKELGPLVEIPYVAQEIFVPFFKKLSNSDPNTTQMHTCLDLMWTFFEIHEMKACLESSVVYLSSVFRQVSVNIEYPEQRTALAALNSLCQHEKTRQFLLQFVLFDKVKFASFLHVKPLEESCLMNVVNKVWWETNPTDSIVESAKIPYFKACEKIKDWVTEVEVLQVKLLTLLLNNKDGCATTPTSRTIFLRKFRRFVQVNILSGRPISTNQIPLPIALCCFQRLLVTFKLLWDAEVGTSPVFVPVKTFCDGSINYAGIDRLGGVLSHLTKTFRNDLQQLLGAENENATETDNSHLTTNLFRGGTRVEDSPVISVFARMININSLNSGGSTILERIGYFPYNREDRTPLQLGPIDSAVSLYELLDGLIMFYHVSAKKQIAQVSTLREAMGDFIVAMCATKSRLEIIQKTKDEESQQIESQLMKTIEIFDEKLSELSRHMAWVRAAIYSDENQERLAWLLKIVISTLQSASQSGNLFSFVPEFYLEALGDIVTGLKNHIHPTAPLENIPHFKLLLQDVAQFLCDHFLDSRIVNANSKDTMILALAGFASNPLTLEALENVPFESRSRMVANLLRSYENRAWAQSNWILVRFWQGHGFAFRYDKSPHMANKIGPKILTQETTSQTMKPCPSVVFQEHVRHVLLSNNQSATLFLNSLLNQLNWAFSEFIGMLQEIHNVSSRPQRVLIESRQLKVCATCFDLAVSLIRVLEMIASKAVEIFADPSLPTSDNLLARLCQLICQILNRTSTQTSSFQHVVLLEIPDLQSVDHFPIVTSVIGIVVALLKDDMALPLSDNVPRVTRALISEPSFQIASLHFALGDSTNGKIQNMKKFSLLNYESYVSKEEIASVQRVIQHLDHYRTKLPLAETPCSDDDLCTICYAYPVSAMFKPCNHTSCQSCIDRHLLNSRDCFFCKATIKQVVSIDDNRVLHEFSSGSSIESMDSES
uniref:RING-type E3 ubiquitin transferase n=1 Tax=Trichogramma kaykai TaxID=54128 RepID=A0ABD2WQJ0_9HYME